MKTRKPKPSGSSRREHPDHPAQPHAEAVRALLSPAGAPRRPRPPFPAPKRPPELPDPFEGLLTPQQAAELFNVTTRTIRNWRTDGLLEPVLRPKGRVFYRLEDLLRLFEPAKPAIRKPVKIK